MAQALHEQAAEYIRGRIQSGEYPVGSQIPTENELCALLGVSRPTLRQALDTLARDCKTSGVFTAAQDPDLVRLLTSLALSAVRNPVSPYDEDRLLLLLLDVLLKLGTLGSDLPAPSRADLPTDKIMPALILLSDAIRAGRPVSIADMAEACHFSQSHFRKLFLEAMGTSPKDYMIQEQLKFAAQLLRTTAAPIAQIQQRTGFVDGSVFFRNFVRKYNCSPSAFRKASRTEKAGK